VGYLLGFLPCPTRTVNIPSAGRFQAWRAKWGLRNTQIEVALQKHAQRRRAFYHADTQRPNLRLPEKRRRTPLSLPMDHYITRAIVGPRRSDQVVVSWDADDDVAFPGIERFVDEPAAVRPPIIGQW
jgi:hypothetical protein